MASAAPDSQYSACLHITCPCVGVLVCSACSAVPSDPLPAMNMREKAINWSVAEVCSFFRCQGMDRVASLFHACRIDGRQMSQCTFQLQGIPSVSRNVQTYESLFARFARLAHILLSAAYALCNLSPLVMSISLKCSSALRF